MVTVRFASGTIEVVGLPADFAGLRATSGARSACHRAPGMAYADVLRACKRLDLAYDDQARRYDVLATGAQVRREPRPYQHEALAAWRDRGGRGVVVLPTGAGKTL